MKFCSRILLSVYEYAVFYGGLFALGLVCLHWSVVAVILYPLLPARVGRPLGRVVIMAAFRMFLAVLTLSGRFRFDLSALDTLRDEKELIIAPNHPSLWDVVLIASRLPDLACIMKNDIVNNIFLGAGARLARYIPNEPLRQMITIAAKDLERGSQLLLFPEGTRTVRQPIGPLKGSVGVIANRAQVPVQTVIIETDSLFLAKGWPVYKKPQLPMTYRIRLGRRFDPPASSAVFMAELEQYFANELAPAASPHVPASVPATAAAD